MTLEDEHERVMTLMKNLLQFFSNTNIVKPDQIKNVSSLCVLRMMAGEPKTCGILGLSECHEVVLFKTVFVFHMTGIPTCV